MAMNYLGLVWENFKRKKLRSWLTVIGILIGITAVVSLIALGQGLQTAISSQFSFLSPDLITVSAAQDPFTKVTHPLEKSYLQDLAKINGVKATAGRIMGPANVETKNSAFVTMAVSIPDGNEGRKLMLDALKIKLQEGKLPEKDYEVLVGNNVIDQGKNAKNDFKIGSEITVKGTKFKIVGITPKSMLFIWSSVAIALWTVKSSSPIFSCLFFLRTFSMSAITGLMSCPWFTLTPMNWYLSFISNISCIAFSVKYKDASSMKLPVFCVIPTILNFVPFTVISDPILKSFFAFFP